MNEETKRAIWIVGQWLLSSVSATELDRLFEHMNGERLESDMRRQVADELRLSLGHEAFQ